MDYSTQPSSPFFQTPGPQVATEYPELSEGLSPNQTDGHVLYPTFGFTPQPGGYATIDIIERISNYLIEKPQIRLKKNIKHRGFLIERLVRELYCDVFGISDLNNKDKPFAMVEVGPKDGYHELSPLYARIREFRIYSIHERYSIDLIDFLNLPRHLTDRLIEDSRIGSRNIEKIQSNVEGDARAQLKKEGFRTNHL